MTSSDFNFLKELNCKSEESGAEAAAKEDPGGLREEKKLSEALRRLFFAYGLMGRSVKHSMTRPTQTWDFFLLLPYTND